MMHFPQAAVHGVRMPIDLASPVGQGSTCPCTSGRPLTRNSCEATRKGGVAVEKVNQFTSNCRLRRRRRRYDEVTEGSAGTYRGPQTFGVMQDGTGKAPLTLGDPQLVEQSLALYVR